MIAKALLSSIQFGMLWDLVSFCSYCHVHDTIRIPLKVLDAVSPFQMSWSALSTGLKLDAIKFQLALKTCHVVNAHVIMFKIT